MRRLIEPHDIALRVVDQDGVTQRFENSLALIRLFNDLLFQLVPAGDVAQDTDGAARSSLGIIEWRTADAEPEMATIQRLRGNIHRHAAPGAIFGRFHNRQLASAKG